MDWLLVMGIKKGLVKYATVCVKSEVLLTFKYSIHSLLFTRSLVRLSVDTVCPTGSLVMFSDKKFDLNQLELHHYQIKKLDINISCYTMGASKILNDTICRLNKTWTEFEVVSILDSSLDRGRLHFVFPDMQAVDKI